MAGAALASPTAWAVPVLLPVQAALSTAGGGPVADGTYALTFRLYADATVQDALWSEVHVGVPVKGGLVLALLGKGTLPAPLDSAIFAQNAAAHLSLQVESDAEMPRVRLHPVAYASEALHAGSATKLDAPLPSEGIAAGAVTPEKLAFTYAGSDTKGGAATTAKLSEDVACTGCVGTGDLASGAVTADKIAAAAIGAAHFAAGAVDGGSLAAGAVGKDKVSASFVQDLDLATNASLKPVAFSGAYGDLTGGPDLTPFAKLADANTWAGEQTLSAGADFAKQQAKLFRFQNAASEPAACDASAVGLAWYDTGGDALKVCNGKAWVTLAKLAALGSPGNPGAACKPILDADAKSADGLYWVDPDGGGANAAFQVWCDMTGGGWTLIAKVNIANVDNLDEPKDWFQQTLRTNLLADAKMANNGNLASYGIAKFTPYLTNASLARFTIVAQLDTNQTAAWYKVADPAAAKNWFNGDSVATKVCTDAAMSKNCTTGVIAYAGDATTLGGMNLTSYGYSGGTIHMRLNSDGAPSYSAVCSSTGDNNGNAWKDSYATHWGNGLLISIR